MQSSIAENPNPNRIAVIGGAVPRNQVPRRLWQSLTDAWLRHLDRRVGSDVRWLGHDGVTEDFRSASHG